MSEALEKASKHLEEIEQQIEQAKDELQTLKQQPAASEFTKKCRAMADVFLESTTKLTEEKLAELLESDWNGVGFLMRVYGEILEGRLAAKESLEACDRLDITNALNRRLKKDIEDNGKNPASEFTKKVRLNLENWGSTLYIQADVRVKTVVGWLTEALKIIDNLESINADLLDACKYSHTLILRKIGQSTHAVALLEVVIAKAIPLQ